MTEVEFTALPVGLALALVYRSQSTRTPLKDMPAPRPVLPPKYDQRIRRKGGFQWASETDLDGLRFWERKADEGVNDPEWGTKNARESKALDFWIHWRAENPTSRILTPPASASPRSQPSRLPAPAPRRMKYA